MSSPFSFLFYSSLPPRSSSPLYYPPSTTLSLMPLSNCLFRYKYANHRGRNAEFIQFCKTTMSEVNRLHIILCNDKSIHFPFILVFSSLISLSSLLLFFFDLFKALATHLPTIQSLDMTWCIVHDNCVGHFSLFTQLTHLSLQNSSQISDIGKPLSSYLVLLLHHLSRLPLFHPPALSPSLVFLSLLASPTYY